MKLINKPDVREFVLNKYKKRCSYCGCTLTILTLCIDHITPVCRGEFHSGECIENFNPACQTCNSSKSSYTLEEWRKRILNTVDRVYNDGALSLGRKFGLVRRINKPIIFYFEKLAV